MSNVKSFQSHYYDWLEARVAKLEYENHTLRKDIEKARLELLEGEGEPTDNAVDILTAALEAKP